MKLAIIGSGTFGKAFGIWAAASGYEVTFAATQLAHAEQAAKEAGHGARAASTREAIQNAELVLLAVNFQNMADVVREADDAIKGKVLIDPINAVKDDLSGLQLGPETSTTEELMRLAPEARVVKAFSTIFAAILTSHDAKVKGQPLTVVYAGDDEEAKGMVKSMIEKMGFDAVDAGPAMAARIIDGLGLMNIWLGYGRKFGTSIGFSLLRK